MTLKPGSLRRHRSAYIRNPVMVRLRGSRGSSAEKPKSGSFWGWVGAHKAAIVTIVTTTAGAIWAFVQLVWPSFILPMFDTGRLDVVVAVEEVGRDADKSAQRIQIDLKNGSSTRFYLPGAYLLARADSVVRRGSESAAQKSPEKKSELTADQLTVIRRAVPAAVNVLFDAEWRKQMDHYDLRSEFDIRGMHVVEGAAAMNVLFSQISGAGLLLEPGESTKVVRIAFVPIGYDLMTVELVGRVTKKLPDERVFLGVPAPSGLGMITISRQYYAPSGVLEFEKFRKDGTNKLKEDLGQDQFEVRERVQVYVGAHSVNSKAASAGSTSGNEVKAVGATPVASH